MTDEEWLDNDCPTEFVDVVDDEGYILFSPDDSESHFVLVPDNFAAALRETEHRIVQFKPIVITCGCYSGCDIILEIHDNGDLIMVDGLVQEVIKVSVMQVSAVCDAYYIESDDDEEIVL